MPHGEQQEMKPADQKQVKRFDKVGEGIYGTFSLVSASLLFTMTVLISTLLLLLVFGYRPLFIKSGSMEPTIPVGSVVLSRVIDARDARPGEVITFSDPKNPEETLTHRIKHVSQDSDGRISFITQGDANSGTEDFFIDPSKKVGLYLGHITALGYLVAWMTQPTIRIALLGIVILYFVYAGMRWIWRR